MIRIYRYDVDNESFLAVDGRDVTIPRFRQRKTVHALCLMHGLDGVIILDKSDKADFRMELYGKDGNAAAATSSAACVSVAFADLLGVKPFHTKDYMLEFVDGSLHAALIGSHLGECKMVQLDGAEALAVMCEGEFD